MARKRKKSLEHKHKQMKEYNRKRRERQEVRDHDKRRYTLYNQNVRRSPIKNSQQQQQYLLARERDRLAKRRRAETANRRRAEIKKDAAKKRIARLSKYNKYLHRVKLALSRIRKGLQARTSILFLTLLSNFNKLINQSPSFICSCCGGLWYPQSVQLVTRKKLVDLGRSRQFIDQVICVPTHVARQSWDIRQRRLHLHHEGGEPVQWNGQHYFCTTCHQLVIKKNKVPSVALSNGLMFPDIPEVLKNLSELEERLISARLPFMKILFRGPEKQLLLRGNVVNVENNLDVCAKVLPRKFNQASIVQVQLMRNMNYRWPYMSAAISPSRVYKAAKLLLKSTLYKSHKIKECDDWRRFSDGDQMCFASSIEDLPPVSSLGGEGFDARPFSNCMVNHPSEFFDSDTVTDADVAPLSATPPEEEDMEPDPFDSDDDNAIDTAPQIPSEETLIFNDTTQVHGVRLAPAQRNQPISMHMDPDAERLSFPTIYCGQKEKIKEGVKLTYTKIAKSEARRYDRRAAKPHKILYAFKKSFNQKVHCAIRVMMRRRCGPITKKQALDCGFQDRLIKKDEGYAFFRNVKCSPAYWRQKKKNTISMVRQLGTPSFFITLSAAETRWEELLIMLKELVDGEFVKADEVRKLSYAEKARLVKSDPVTCARHFDHRYRAMLNNLLGKPGGVFSPYKLADYFSRIEYQKRGSPHSHGLYWLKNSPKYEPGNIEKERECIRFIDEFITCERSFPPMPSTSTNIPAEDDWSPCTYQLHKHTFTCKRKQGDGYACRFGFPRPPLENTMILTPHPKSTPVEDKKRYEANFKIIQSKLEKQGRDYDKDKPFEQFLQKLGLTREEYVLAIRSSIKRTTVFLKRKTNAAFINNYNEKMLRAWRANMDIQYVVDGFATAAYCVSYMLKSDGGISAAMRRLSKEIQRGNFTAQQRMRKYGSLLIKGSEICAQEASAFILGQPSTFSSRTSVFVPTCLPDKRAAMLLPRERLEKIDAEDSLDVCFKGLIHRYANRKRNMEDINLADFACKYSYTGSQPSCNQTADSDGAAEESSDEEGCVDDATAHPTGAKPTYKCRKKPKILRFVGYSRKGDPQNYCREQLLLFIPWRVEQTEVISPPGGVVQRYKELETLIMRRSKEYYSDRNVNDATMNNILAQMDAEEAHEGFLDDSCETPEEDDLFPEISLPTANTSPEKDFEQFLPPSLIPEQEYKWLMRSLNEEQSKFVLNVLHELKLNGPPFYHCLLGSAGTGKSHVISAIVQSYLRFEMKDPNFDADGVYAIVAAPTGKAAFNVFGMTLHSAFNFKAKQAVVDLEAAPLNTIRQLFQHVKLIIIDEVSMVGCRMLYDIDRRLCEIFDTDPDVHFGGKSLIVVGDFHQLPPVGDYPVYAPPAHLTFGRIAGNPLWEKFQLYKLQEVVRQQNDPEFKDALNHMPSGPPVMNDRDISLMRSCEVGPTRQAPPDAIHLYFRNEQCEEHNRNFLAQLQGDEHVSIAEDQIEGRNLTEEDKQTLSKELDTFKRKDTYNLPYELHLKVGAQYFVSINVDVRDGLFNGAHGKLENIQRDGEGNVICVWMSFTNKLVGSRRRETKRTYMETNNINLMWVPIARVKKTFSVRRNNCTAKVIRRQFPLVPCNAMTIHKAQGSTMDVVVASLVDRNNKPLSRELIYVVCSRARTADGLYILGQFEPPPPPPREHPVNRELRRLAGNPVQFSLRFLQDWPDDFERFYFHNISRFLPHREDIEADPCAMSATIVALVEPWLVKGNNASLTGFSTAFRLNCPCSCGAINSDRNCQCNPNSEGALAFVKRKPKRTAFGVHRTERGHMLILIMATSATNIVVIYRHPNYPQGLFLDTLEQQLAALRGNILLVGDINVDMRNSQGNVVRDRLGRLGLTPKLDETLPTTEAGSHLDICYSNMANVHCWIYESYYSYHKPICAVWLKTPANSI